ncbi:MAG: DUF1684 domain-containing protein [Bacteroidota bacterium]
MTKYFFLVLIVFAISCKQKTIQSSSIDKDRAAKIIEYSNPETSPFNAEEIKEMGTLKFFEADEKYKVKATLHRIPDLPFFEMPHSNNVTRSYQKFGEITFELNGKNFTLPVYSNEQFKKEHDLFFPFRDLTNVKETYGGGRFMDLKYSDSSDVVEVDFNLSYHPYCAHSHRYHCPIVPKENAMDIEVKAGEKL